MPLITLAVGKRRRGAAAAVPAGHVEAAGEPIQRAASAGLQDNGGQQAAHRRAALQPVGDDRERASDGPAKGRASEHLVKLGPIRAR